jgi:hypothetical protein
MHAILPRLILPGAVISVGLIAAIALFAGAKLAAHLDPASHESHLPGFMVVIGSLAVAVASAFPIFGRAVPWASARLRDDALDASGSFPSS